MFLPIMAAFPKGGYPSTSVEKRILNIEISTTFISPPFGNLQYARTFRSEGLDVGYPYMRGHEWSIEVLCPGSQMRAYYQGAARILRQIWQLLDGKAR